MKKLIELIINEDALMELGVDAIALVENPAIEENFLYFKKEEFVEPRAGEDEGEFIGRCMSSLEGEFPADDQRLAVCYTYWEGSDEFQDLEDACWPGYEAIGLKPKGGRMVPNCVPVKNSKQRFESYNDYPESATAAAKRALEWRDAHPDQKCGTPVGWARANQLAKGENISEETIARMASFARHLQYKDVPYSEGCGGLMVDAWGGQAGIEWASNKLESIRTELQDEREINVLGYNTRHFKLCPGATATFEHLVSMNPNEEVAGMIRSAAIQADTVFAIEQRVLDAGVATLEDLYEATLIVKDFFDLMAEIDALVGMEHNIDYMYGHLDVIGNLVPDEDFAIDTSGLPAYVDEITDEDKKGKRLIAIIKDVYPESFAAVTGFLTRGLTRDEVLKAKFRNGTNVYRYEKAGSGEPSRSFCESIEGRFFRRFAIDALKPYNTEFGHNGQEYSVWNYKGGPNCVHAWKRYIIVNGDLQDDGFVEGQPGTPPKNMPNNGYYSPETKRKSEVAYIVSQQNMSDIGQQYAFNEDKRIVTGPLMIPNMEIPRKAEDGSRYYVYFTEDTIRQIAEKFAREKKLDRTNIEHDSEDIRDQNYLFETWIVEDSEMDKAKALGFNVPKGTWMGSMRVMDDTTWNMVKEGKIKGFSVEGFFGEMSPAKEDEDLYNQVRNLVASWNGQ